MPTGKPRLTVTFEPETYEVIARLAKAQDRSAGAVVREIMEAAQEPLARVAAFLEQIERQREQIQAGQRDVVRGLRRDFTKAEREASEALKDVLSQLDMFLAQGNASAEQSEASAAPAEGGEERGQPPLGNTGVRSEGERGSKRRKRPSGKGSKGGQKK